MNKIKINMIGGPFQHDICSCSGSVPKFIEWDKTGNSNISIHLDDGMRIPTNKQKKNYAWIFEASTVIPHIIDWAVKNIIYLEENFEYIFTHDAKLLNISNKMRLMISSPQPWVKDIGIHSKNKLVSMIVSKKNMCNEHSYRLSILDKYKNIADCFGNGHNPISTKEYGLKDYYFSFAMENGAYDYMYTEKILDCFATGTIPIYWGMPSIGEFFNINGIILLNEEFDINKLKAELYLSKYDAIVDNLERTLKIPIAEDYLYLNYIK
jgi:hypothetical protein